MSFGLRLKQARELKKLTQAQLGQGLGEDGADAGKQVIYGWEKDKHHPTVRQLALICARLGESADWLLFGKRPEYDMKSLNGLEAQLVIMYRGLSNEAQDDLLQAANAKYTHAHPESNYANPYGPISKVKQ